MLIDRRHGKNQNKGGFQDMQYHANIIDQGWVESESLTGVIADKARPFYYEAAS